MAYGKLRTRGWTFKAEGVYGQNLHHLTMLGGYGVERVADPVLLTRSYIPFDTLSLWAEAHTNGARWQGGRVRRPTPGTWARAGRSRAPATAGAPISATFSGSRRASSSIPGKLRLAAEAELTSAAYGAPDAQGRVRDATRAANVRLLLATYYFF